MNIVIDNLILVGNTGVSDRSGIVVTLWGSSYYSIYGLTVNNVDVSGFTRGGMSSYRKPGNGFISNVAISNSAFHDNPGYSGYYGVQGSGIVMAGVQYCTVSNVKAYNNGGAVTTSPGPIGTWFFDADHVTVSDSSFYNNLSADYDGGGLDFDCGTTNSVFQRVYTWNNWGAGYSVNSCSSGQGYNNDGSSMNIVMESSTSYGDSYHRKDCLLCVAATNGNYASNILFQDMTLTANGYGRLAVESSYSFWNYQYNQYQIVGLWVYGQMYQISTKNVQFIFDSTTFSADLYCNGFNPTCVSQGLALPPTNMPIAAPTWMPVPAPTRQPIAAPTNKPVAAPVASPVASPVQTSTGGRSFYVSSIRSTASDSNAGTSASYPWRTLAKVQNILLYDYFRLP